MLINLLNNAAKYTDPGGRIEAGFETAGAEVRLGVADNGIGIDPAMQQAVFEMFVQVDQSLERGRAGLGVGLSLARQLVALHGGRIELHSEGLGCGSTFVVCLPRCEMPQPVAAAPAAATPQGRAARVLLADDNRDFADSLAAVLRGLGHRVRVVYDGRAALDAALGGSFEVGLFDVGMPGMNGYDLAAALRRSQAGPPMLLVAITGWGQDADQRRAREAGFDHHLVKPVDAQAVVALLAARAP